MKPLIVAVIVLGSVAGLLAALRPVQASSQSPSAAECTMPTDLRFTRGALAPHGDQIYQCLPVFGDNLKPIGVAWVEMVRKGDGFVPKGGGGR